MMNGLLWSCLIFKLGLNLFEKGIIMMVLTIYSEMQYTSCIIETLSGGIIHYIIQEVMIIWFL